MSEQMFCSKCGKLNWSQHSETCECKYPNFNCATYEEFLRKQEKKEMNKLRSSVLYSDEILYVRNVMGLGGFPEGVDIPCKPRFARRTNFSYPDPKWIACEYRIEDNDGDTITIARDRYGKIHLGFEWVKEFCMKEDICKNEIYVRDWSGHKNGFIKLIYNSGSYATCVKEQDGEVVRSYEIIIRCKDGDLNIEKYAKEKGYIKAE